MFEFPSRSLCIIDFHNFATKTFVFKQTHAHPHTHTHPYIHIYPYIRFLARPSKSVYAIFVNCFPHPRLFRQRLAPCFYHRDGSTSRRVLSSEIGCPPSVRTRSIGPISLPSVRWGTEFWKKYFRRRNYSSHDLAVRPRQNDRPDTRVTALKPLWTVGFSLSISSTGRLPLHGVVSVRRTIFRTYSRRVFIHFRDTNGPTLVLFYFVRENDNNDARARCQVRLDTAQLTCDMLLFSYSQAYTLRCRSATYVRRTLTSDEVCSAAAAHFVRHHDHRTSVSVWRPLYGPTYVFLFINFF